MAPQERGFFRENGYLHVWQVVGPALLARFQDEFEQIWAVNGRTSQLVLAKHRRPHQSLGYVSPREFRDKESQLVA